MHTEVSRGRIHQLLHTADYGHSTPLDEREIYFNRNSILNMDFDDLVIGDMVRFHEEVGNDGPQASTVKVER